jgi:hypothetical protein
MERYILTSHGKHWFDHPEATEYTGPMLAAPLSRICRFTGHTRTFYSVAQHSVHVADMMARNKEGRKAVLCGLLHDGAEAFLGDVSSPLKAILGESYRELERPTTAAIMAHWGVDVAHMETVKRYDMIALATEKRDLMPHDPTPWSVLEGIFPDPEPIIPWQPCIAEEQFLQRLELLTCAPL